MAPDERWRGTAGPAPGFPWAYPGDLFLAQHFERDLIGALAQHGFHELSSYRILDVGCEDGAFLRRLLVFGAHAHRMAGLDPLPERVVEAKRKLSRLDVRPGTPNHLPFEPASYDLVFQRGILSTIQSAAERMQVASELARMAKPGGLVVSYEPRGDRPPRLLAGEGGWGVRAGELAVLFPGFTLDVRRVTLHPPLARALAPRSWLLCELLTTLRPLRTYELALLRAP